MSQEPLGQIEIGLVLEFVREQTRSRICGSGIVSKKKNVGVGQ